MSATETAGIWKDGAPAPAEPPFKAMMLPRPRSDHETQKAKAREERTAPLNQSAQTAAAPPKTVVAEKPGAKRITVSVTYDESGRVTQASGGDASAVRIARQKRFPQEKPGQPPLRFQ